MLKRLKIIFIVFLIYTMFSSGTALAWRGCCSHHGWQSYCGSNWMRVCNDGTESPSCTCGYVRYEEPETVNYYKNTPTQYNVNNTTSNTEKKFLPAPDWHQSNQVSNTGNIEDNELVVPDEEIKTETGETLIDESDTWSNAIDTDSLNIEQTVSQEQELSFWQKIIFFIKSLFWF